MKTYRPVLLSEDTYEKLKRLKKALEEESGKATFNSIIRRLVSTEYAITALDKDVREYLYNFAEKIKKFDDVIGAAIFGSVARGTYRKYSDIDLFIVVADKTPRVIEKLYSVRSELHEYEDRFLKKGLYLYISPLIVAREDLASFRPIYIDIARDGIILFERDSVLSDFFKRINRIKTSYDIIEGVRVMRWKKTG